MKTGFSKRKNGDPKEDITRERDSNPKCILGGLALTTILLGGLAIASLKIADKFSNKES